MEWIAPGLEIVQSHMPDCKFTAADTVADSGRHARLLVGRRIPVAALPRDAAAFDAQLAGDRITLYRGGQRINEGVGTNVLDGPLHALAHFPAALRDCPGATDLQPGDVVTTGTWTDAWPVHRGEQWRAESARRWRRCPFAWCNGIARPSRRAGTRRPCASPRDYKASTAATLR